MKNLSNEKGYALLLVLFLIVFITILSAVFIRGSLSNAKQEKNVDTQHLTVTTAEAGIDYYKTLLLNRYHESLTDLDQIANAEITRQQQEITNKKRTSIDYTIVKKLVRNELYSRLDSEIQSTVKNKHEMVNNQYEFQISKRSDSQYLTAEENGILFQATVTGKNDKKNITKALQLQVDFPIKDYSTQSPPSGSTANKIDIYNLYPDDSQVPACGSSKDIKNEKCKADRNEKYEQIKDHSIVYFPNGYTKGNVDLDMKNNTKIYSKYSSANAQTGFEANKLVVKNSSLFTHTGSLKVSELVVKDSANFFVNSAMNIEKNAEFKDNSVIAIRGSGAFGDELVIKENTTVCIDGSINVVGKFELKNNSKIFIFGVLSKQPEGNGEVIQVGPTEVFDHCSLSSSEKSEWPSPALDVTYD